MSYIDKNTYFAELNGSSSSRTFGGSNGVGTGIKGILTFSNERHWIDSNIANTDFTVYSECLIQGASQSTNSGSDFYHRYGITGNNLSCAYSGQSNAEAAGSFSKIDEDVFSITNVGTFSFELTGKYNSGYFCDENSKLVVLRLGY
jgi:hypothetical protein